MFTCSTLLLFPYPVPAYIHGSVQHVTLERVPVDVLPRLFSWFSQVRHFKCHGIRPPLKVQCVHMYSVAYDVQVICTNPYLTETGLELCMYGGSWGEGLCGGTVWEKLGEELLVEGLCGIVAQMCGWLCGGSMSGTSHPVKKLFYHIHIMLTRDHLSSPVRHPHVTSTNIWINNHLNLLCILHGDPVPLIVSLSRLYTGVY